MPYVIDAKRQLARLRSPVAALTVWLLATSSAMAATELKVVVSSKPIHALVASVMGTSGTPTVLVAGSASPHSYAMKPSDARVANGAAAFFRVGGGFEPWTDKLVLALPKTVKVVSLLDAPGLKVLNRRETGAFESGEQHDGHGHGVKKASSQSDDERDPHVWLDPANANALVDHIASVLSALEPATASLFKSNAAATRARIDALNADLERELRPHAGQQFVVLHDAYQYFEGRFGLTAVGSIAVSPERAPSGKRLIKIREKIAATGASCVFAEPGLQPKIVAAVVEGTAARPGLLDPEATQLPPSASTYDDLMRALSRDFRRCFEAR
jgi:zinc transport system substrate-binding protein